MVWPIIVDGADQSAFGFPHFVRKPKDDKGHALKVRLIELIDSQNPNRFYIGTMTEEHKTGQTM